MLLTSIIQKTVISSVLATNMLVGPYITTTAQSVTPPEPQIPAVCQEDKNSKECVVELIEQYALKYKVDRRLALDIAFCESTFKSEVYGDNGKAFGTFQFHEPTFKLFSKKFKEEFGRELSYQKNQDGIELAMWALSNDKEHHWTCFKKVSSR